MMSKQFIRKVAWTLCWLMLFMPVLSYASTTSTPAPVHISDTSPTEPVKGAFDKEMTACTDAEAQALSDTNSALWLIGGCVAPIIVIILAQVIEPAPPATALLGQDPEYVAEYTDCYERAAKKRRTNRALIGCGIAAALWAIYIGVVVLAAESTNDYYF